MSLPRRQLVLAAELGPSSRPPRRTPRLVGVRTVGPPRPPPTPMPAGHRRTPTRSPAALGRRGRARVKARHCEQHPQALRPDTEPVQPTPDGTHRPVQQRSDAAVPQAGCLDQQALADHLDRVRPAQQRGRRQQHVRAPALRARRTTRTQRHNRGLAPDSSLARVAPRPQLTSAVRTAKLTRPKELVDLERTRTYHQQRVPLCFKRRPSLPAKRRGGPLRFQARRHALVANKEGQPTGPPWRSSSPSMTPEHLHVVSQRGVQQLPVDAGRCWWRVASRGVRCSGRRGPRDDGPGIGGSTLRVRLRRY